MNYTWKWREIFKQVLVLLLVLGLGFASAACSVLPQKEPVEVYILSPGNTEPQFSAVTSAILKIPQPNASGLLDSANIIVMPQSHRLSVYKGARWNDALPRMLQDYLIRDFRTVTAFEAVVNNDTGVTSDYQLVTDIRAFQSSYLDTGSNRDNPVIEVEIDAQLIDTQTSTIVSQRRFSMTEPSSGTHIDTVVEAFNRAAGRLSNAMLEWTVRSIKQQEQ